MLSFTVTHQCSIRLEGYTPKLQFQQSTESAKRLSGSHAPLDNVLNQIATTSLHGRVIIDKHTSIARSFDVVLHEVARKPMTCGETNVVESSFSAILCEKKVLVEAVISIRFLLYKQQHLVLVYNPVARYEIANCLLA